MSDETEPGAAGQKPVRHLDARSLRGLAHPLRMSILDALTLDGPATATGLSARLGENTGTVSWHLRHLAQHGFIEEETGRGTKRERWWRVIEDTKVLETADFRDDPGTRGALSIYMHELVQQYFSRVTNYLSEDWDGDWQRAGTIGDWRNLRLTPDQLTSLNAEIMNLIARYAAAPGEATEGALPVIVQLQSFPRKERENS
ncbi:winged helix-turn-helix domain-containing protein [Streptomyces sp. NPDC054841]